MFKYALQTITELTVDRPLQRLTNISVLLIMLPVEETDHTTSGSPPYSLR